MKETPPAKGKGAPILFHCQPTDDRGGPCHAPDCDGRSSCMPQLRRTQKIKDGQSDQTPGPLLLHYHVWLQRQEGALRG